MNNTSPDGDDPHGRRSYDRISSLEDRLLTHMTERLIETQAINNKIDELVILLKANESKAEEVLTLYANLKGAFRLLAWIEVPATWIAKITMACGIIWGLWKFVFLETLQRSPTK